MIVYNGCKYCHGTGDWRGLYGKTKPDYRSEENKCLHCDGTGDDKTVYHNKCKYCDEPCNGYACERCLQTFESEKDFDVIEEEIA